MSENKKKLPEQIGKGIDEVQLKKVLDARRQLVGVQVCETVKEQFKLACKKLEIKQTDVLKMAINETIKKASK